MYPLPTHGIRQNAHEVDVLNMCSLLSGRTYMSATVIMITASSATLDHDGQGTRLPAWPTSVIKCDVSHGMAYTEKVQSHARHVLFARGLR